MPESEVEKIPGAILSDGSGDGLECPNPECAEKRRVWREKEEAYLTERHGPNWREKLGRVE